MLNAGGFERIYDRRRKRRIGPARLSRAAIRLVCDVGTLLAASAAADASIAPIP
jgi:hypothetical protein